MYRLGPRRAAVLYATNAPFAAVLGFLVLGEELATVKLIGIVLVVVGVWIAVAYRETGPAGHWEEVRGRLGAGIAFGLTGGLSAALAALIARPVMAAGVDPAVAASVRAAVGLHGLIVLACACPLRAHRPVTGHMLALAALSGLLGMAAGMTLVLFALSMRPTGIVTTLASTTPVLLLPLLWLINGKKPAPQAWLGAALAVGGVAVLSNQVF
jgi:drug/metabolite transporter (DMT)-like permease